MKYLERKYYENDETGFYYRKMNLSCPEQMIYQSLRDYDLDFDFFFLEDINLKVFKREDSYIVKPNTLNCYGSRYREVTVTEDYNNASEVIDWLLKKGKLVIFQAPTDKLKTYSWYKPRGEATIVKHNAIIVGQDSEHYFYLDSPPTRSKKYFQPHPDNSAVGLILKHDLLDVFKIKCRISYIEANNNILKEMHTVKDICVKIIENYYQGSSENGDIIGAEALEALATILEENKKTNFNDAFISNLMCSHLKRLYCCGLKTKFFRNEDEICKIIKDGIAKWEIIENLVIKWGITNANTYSIVKNIKEYQIISKKLVEGLKEKVDCSSTL